MPISTAPIRPPAAAARRGLLHTAAMAAAMATAMATAWLLPLAAAAQAAAPADASALLAADGHVLLIRHANAPGVGDPPQLKLGDCSTQRNLDEAGRAQARALGDALRAKGLRAGAVWTSPWCRTRDTAALAFPATPARVVPAAGSTFEQPERRAEQAEALRRQLLAWRGPGVLVVVTHQVVITALTGGWAASGEAVLLRRVDEAAGARYEPALRLPPP